MRKLINIWHWIKNDALSKTDDTGIWMSPYYSRRYAMEKAKEAYNRGYREGESHERLIRMKPEK